MEEFVYYNQLYDCYGNLLTEKQQIYFEEYYFHNLSLSEISENYQVSRNAVYKQLQITKEKLVEYENKLEILKKKEELENISADVKDPNLKKRLQQLFSILFLFVICSFSNVYAQNSIDQIDITVDLEQNGTAHITEAWDVYVDSGTELYKTYGNMENYSIQNFQVIENNRIYQSLDTWNSHQSFDQKKYKSGIVVTSTKQELCWGISEYGRKKYILTYDIENMIKQYNDGQIIYFSLMPTDMDPSPQKVHIVFKSQLIQFNTDNSFFKAYGYQGNINISNGMIQMMTTEPLLSNYYMTALIQIHDSVFSLNDRVNRNFADVQKEADSTISNINSDHRVVERRLDWIVKILIFVIILVPIILLVSYIIKKKTVQSNKLHTSSHINQDDIPDINSVSYQRDIPFDGDLEKIYWICSQYHFMEDQGSIIGAYLLKWLHEKRIKMVGDSQKFCLDFSNIGTFEEPLEEKLKNIFLSASSRDYTLEPFEFKEWCREQYGQVISWLESYLYEGKSKLIELGYLDKQKVVLNHGGGKVTTVKTTITEKMKDPIQNILGLKKFLLDFSIINERESVEVSTWDQYLIISYLLGIADQVSDEFQKIYPKYQFIENLDIKKLLAMSSDYEKVAYEFCWNQYHESKEGKSHMPSNGKSVNGSFTASSGGGISSGGHGSGGGIR